MADIVFPGQTAGGPLGSGLLPANYDLVLYRGDYAHLRVTVSNAGVPVDLTGATAQCQIRATFDSNVSYDATCTLTNAAGGVVDVEFPSAVTETIIAGDFIWDFQITDTAGRVRTYIAGDVHVYGEVTR